MIGLALSLLGRLWPYLLGAAVLLYGWHRAETWCNHACVKATDRADEAEAAIKVAQKRATDLALLWAAQVDKAEASNREAEAQRKRAFDALADRAGRLSAAPTVRLSSDADRVWRDSSSQANAARPAAVDQAPTTAVPNPTYSEAELATFFVQSAKAYADAYGQWLACVNNYEGLRSANVVAP